MCYPSDGTKRQETQGNLCSQPRVSKHYASVLPRTILFQRHGVVFDLNPPQLGCQMTIYGELVTERESKGNLLFA